MIKGDTYKHKGMRKRLIDSLRERKVLNSNVLDAMMKIPRHLFLDNAFDEWAYKDTAFQIDSQQTISQPYTVAFQSTLLEVKNGDKILEIGTGSGYQAAVLEELGAHVYSIERHELLFRKSSILLKKLGYTGTRVFFGDGFLGLPKHAPFDKILVTAAAPNIPAKLVEQLKIGGILVIPYGEGEIQEMLKFIKMKNSSMEKQSFGQFKFVPLLKGVSHMQKK